MYTTLSNSISSVNLPPQRIEIAEVPAVGWFVVRQDDIFQQRNYSKTIYANIVDVLAAAIQKSQATGWKLVAEVSA